MMTTQIIWDRVQRPWGYEVSKPNWRRISNAWIVLLLLPVAAHAQLLNPTQLEWQHALSDYQATVRYEAGWYLSETAPAPVQIADLGKPSDQDCPGTTTVICRVSLPTRPALGAWIIRIRAVGTDNQNQPLPSGWSAASNPFSMSLSAPSVPSARP